MRRNIYILFFICAPVWGQSVDHFNGGLVHWWSTGDANEIAVGASASMTEDYYARWPVDKGEPNAVLCTDGVTPGQWFWGPFDANSIVWDGNDFALPLGTPWCVTFVDANGYVLGQDPNDFTYYQPEGAFGVGIENIAEGLYANNYIQVYTLLDFDPNLYNVTIGMGSDDTTVGPNNVRIGHATGDALSTGYQNTLGGNYSGTELTTELDNSFWGFEAGANLADQAAAPFRDEAVVYASNSLFYFLDPDYATVSTQDPGAVCQTVDLDDDGYTYIGRNSSGTTTSRLLRYDLNLNPTSETFYQPSGGWHSASSTVSTVRPTSDGAYVYAALISDTVTEHRVYKFNNTTGAEEWNIPGFTNGMYVDSDDNLYKASGKYDSDGNLLVSYAAVQAKLGNFQRDLWVDEANGKVYACGGGAVCVIDVDGTNFKSYEPGWGGWYAYCVKAHNGKVFITGIRANITGDGTASLWRLDPATMTYDGTQYDMGDVGDYIWFDKDGNLIAKKPGTIYVMDDDFNISATHSVPDGGSTGGHEGMAIPYSTAETLRASRNTAVGSIALKGASGAEPNEAAIVGYAGATTVTDADRPTGIGPYVLGQITSGDDAIGLGPYAGWPITTEDDYLAVDSRKRTTIDLMERQSIIVGHMADDPNDQWLNINVGELNLDLGRFDVNDVNVAGDITTTITDSQVVYSNSGVLAGHADMTWDDTNRILDVNAIDVNDVATLKPNSAVFQSGTDSTTFFQILDADGGTPVFNADSTNERVGIGTASPGTLADIAGVLTFDSAVGDGTATYGIDLSGGTWSSGVMNWDANPDVYVAGARFIHVDDTNQNFMIGTDSFYTTTGAQCIGVGYKSGYYNSTAGGGDNGKYNTYIGSYAGYGNAAGSIGNRNVCIGAAAGYVLTSGSNNFLLGTNAGFSLTTGSRNVFIGTEAGRQLIIGEYNTGIGSHALRNVDNNESHNTAIGYYALYNLNTNAANYNVSIGNTSGSNIVGGTYNTFIGYSAGQGTASATNVTYNVAIGQFSGSKLNTGAFANTFIGQASGYSVTTGGSNVFLGGASGFRQTTNSNLLIIDNRDRGSTANELANSLIYGTFAAAAANQSLRINGEILGSDGAKIGDGGTTNYTQFGTGGFQTMAGSARVTKEFFLPLTDFNPGATGPTAALHGIYPSYDFSIADDMHTSFEVHEDWDTSTAITISVYWAINEDYATNSGEVQWQAAWGAVATGELVTAPTHTGTIDFGDVDIPASANTLVKTSGTIAAASLAMGDTVALNGSRVALDDGANPAAEPYIIRIEVEYTANALGGTL